MKLGKFIWGIIFISLGLLLLGVNFGWWNNDIFIELLYFWPLIIVMIGLRFIIRNESLYALIFLLVIAVMVWVAVVNPYNIRNVIEKTTNNATESENIMEKNMNGLTKMNMTINIGAAKMTVKGSSDANLFHLQTENMSKIETQRNDSNNVSTVKISETGQDFFQSGLQNRKFDLSLSQEVPTNLEINNGASSLDFDLSKVRIDKFNLNTGASSGSIRFGSLTDFISGEIKAGASSLTISVPKGYAVKITNSSALTSFKNVGINLTKNGKIYQTDDYGSNSKKIELVISSGATSITVNQH